MKLACVLAEAAHHHAIMPRPYDRIAESLTCDGDRQHRMRTLVDALWAELAPHGVSWVGFYLHEGKDELVLGPSRNKPACSPIGLHGACGRAFREQSPLVVRDVADLGENYVACDPRDRSELVIPLFEPDGTCWGVLDLDSFDVGSFDQSDVEGLLAVLRAGGLTAPNPPAGKPIVT
jgi:putative methionine-R-sulfoxide reductase with GAF domain